MAELLKAHLESNKDLVQIVRFMLADNCFETEFIVTAILEYIERNMLCENMPCVGTDSATE